MQIDMFSLIEHVFYAAVELCGLFLDDAFQFEDCLSRKCRADCSTTDTMEFVASCSKGSSLQTKRVIEVRCLGRRFGTDIVQLLKIFGIGEMNLVRGDADNWACLRY